MVSLKSSSMLLGLYKGIPSFIASADTADGSFFPPLFERLSGWLITPTISHSCVAKFFSILAEEPGDHANKILIFIKFG